MDLDLSVCTAGCVCGVRLAGRGSVYHLWVNPWSGVSPVYGCGNTVFFTPGSSLPCCGALGWSVCVAKGGIKLWCGGGVVAMTTWPHLPCRLCVVK